MNLPSIFRGRAAYLVLTALLAGCAHRPGPHDDDPAYFARWDSAGVVIAETANEVAYGALPWKVAAEPSFETRPVLGDRPGLLMSTVGVSRSGENTVIVDQGAVGVRFFGPGGELLLRDLGRSGELPGEFEAINLVPAPSADSLVLWDRMNRRFTLLAPDGSGFRLVPRAESPARGDGATIRVLTHLGLIGDMLLMKSTGSDPSGFQDRGVMGTNDAFWLENLYDGERVEIGEFAGVQFLYSSTGAELAQELMESMSIPPIELLITPPFRSPASAAPARGSFVLTKGEGPEILRFGEDGALLSVMRIRKPRPVTASDVEAFVEWRAQALDSAGDMRSGLRAMVGRLPIPEVWPGFERLLVDTEGWTWAQLYHYDPSRSNTWVVFDPEGRAQGTVETPPRLDVHFIGEDFILGVVRDELNVQFVREYALERGASATP